MFKPYFKTIEFHDVYQCQWLPFHNNEFLSRKHIYCQQGGDGVHRSNFLQMKKHGLEHSVPSNIYQLNSYFSAGLLRSITYVLGDLKAWLILKDQGREWVGW